MDGSGLTDGRGRALTLANVRLIDPEADRLRPGSLTLRDGRISAIAFADAAPDEGAADATAAPDTAPPEIVDGRGLCLAPGIVDLGAKVGEPGERHKESFRSVGLAAAAGGVTTIIVRPDTTPAIDSPEMLEFVTRRAAEVSPVRIRHMAALTKGRLGREMVEVGFLLDAGAVAFTDGDHVVSNTKVFGRALTYARALGALVIGHPQDPGLSEGAAATKGKFASLRGLPDVSPMAERLGLERDLALVEMTGARYHADQITTAASLPALARAKAMGLDVSAGTSIHHLTLNEFDVGDYRTFFKLKPPLRSEEDRLAVVEAVGSGLIDIISSMHTPQDEESKRLPFEEAASGAVALETLLPAAMRLYHQGGLTLPGLFRALSLNPARRLGLEGGRLAIGAPADLVLFDPDAPFVLDRFTLRSKSKNTPFDGERMEGRVIATFVGGRLVHGGCDDPGADHIDPLLGITACLAYLLGSIPFGVLVTRAMGLGNLRDIGSGNIGATNVLRTGNKSAALATLLLDGAKGTVAVLVARLALAEDAAQVAGLFAFLGHLFPVWLGFRGGKGVATFLGILLALAWPVGLAALATWAVVAVLTRYSSLSALVAAALSPLWAWGLGRVETVALIVVLALMIFIRHHENIARLIAGTESRIGQKKG